jgi:glycosyltransferase involved in cell wall biosynthesis
MTDLLQTDQINESNLKDVISLINFKISNDDIDDTQSIINALVYVVKNFGNYDNAIIILLSLLGKQDDGEDLAKEIIIEYGESDSNRLYLSTVFYNASEEIDLAYDLIIDFELYKQYPLLSYTIAAKIYNKDPLQSKRLLDLITADDPSLKTGIDSLYKMIYENTGISLVVSVMNREENLTRTLPSWFDCPYVKEYIIIDYSSKKPISENKLIKSWSKQNNIKVVRVENEEDFNMGKAYNIGIDFANYHKVLKIDADYQSLDSSWIEQFITRCVDSSFFVRGQLKFGCDFSGLCLIDKRNFPSYREDLNGYGYDDIDAYTRYEQAGSTPIQFFDASNYVRHIGHSLSRKGDGYNIIDVKESEPTNRRLCQQYPVGKATRSKYETRGNSVYLKKQLIDEIFCINLDSRKDRWDNISKIPFIQRFPAVDTRSNPDIYKEYNLDFKPCDLSASLYFKYHSGAFGAFLSHYLLWKKIVEEKIPHTLVLEDDIHIDSLDSLLKSNVLFQDYDFVQLSNRMRWSDGEILFDGGESYIVSTEGAEKLLMSVHSPRLLKDVIPEKFPSVVKCLEGDEDMTDIPYWTSNPAITCPVDKLMSYCCCKHASDSVRLDYLLYPYILLDTQTSNVSDINEDYNSWEFLESKVRNILSSK